VRIGLYDPHLATLGGGERYFLGVLEEALRLPGAGITLLSPERPDPSSWRRLGIEIPESAFEWRRTDDAAVTELSPQLDLLVAMTNEVPPLSRARRSVAIVQFPHRSHTGLRSRILRALSISRAPAALASYERFLCYSDFARRHIRERLGVDAVVVAPPVELPNSAPEPKQPLILGVGRYFRGWHSKNQNVLLEAIAQLDAPGWRLVLAGGGDDPGYVEELRRRAEGLPAEVMVDVPRDELLELYSRASLFWHAAGHGQDARRHPERLEHFGMTTVEAMAYGAVPLVFPAGGSAEVVEDGRTGAWWRSPSELAARTNDLIKDESRRLRLAAAARQEAERYSPERFRAAVRELVLQPA
jgi:glycosyltransferase involved in cell wall biosynthesis